MEARWVNWRRWGQSETRCLAFRAFPNRWIEWRPKLQVWDAICTDDWGTIQMRMIKARKLRTDDLFAAISFVLNNGKPQ